MKIRVGRRVKVSDLQAAQTEAVVVEEGAVTLSEM